MDFRNSVVVVTGAGSGIGKALALEAAGRGARVAAVDIEASAAEAVAHEIAAAGGEAAAFEADVVDRARVMALASEIEGRFGGVNLLFNNAGVYHHGRLERTKPENLEWLFSVNVFGLFHVFQAFLPLLHRAAQAGQLAHVVATGSENSLGIPIAENGIHTAYTASKHAVLGMTDGLRRDLEGSGIGVSLLCPGVVSTQIWNSARARQNRFGGPQQTPVAVSDYKAPYTREADECARLAFAGVAAGDFMIITDPSIRSYTDRRAADVNSALDRLEQRLST